MTCLWLMVSFIELGSPQTYGASVAVDRDIPISFTIKGLAVDQNDALYVADGNNSMVYKIISTNELVRWAGPFGSFAPYNGNSLALDSAGNCYVMDRDETNQISRINKISASGELSTNVIDLGDLSHYALLALAMTPHDDLCMAYITSLNSGGMLSVQGTGVYKYSSPSNLTKILSGYITGSGTISWTYLGSGPQNYLITAGINSSMMEGYSVVNSYNENLAETSIAVMPMGSIQATAADSRGSMYFSDASHIYRSMPDNPTNVYYTHAGLRGPLVIDRRDRIYTVESGHIIRLAEAPSILLSSHQAESEGNTVVLTAKVFGQLPLACQWSLNGTNLAGETNLSITITNARGSDSGHYSLTVSNEVGTNSAECNLEIITPSQYLTKVVAWGASDLGQCQVPLELTNAVAIAAGDSHSLALKLDGSITAWGTNSGPNATWTGSVTIPASVPPNLTNVVTISAGSANSAVINGDGSTTNWSDSLITRIPLYPEESSPFLRYLKPQKTVVNLLTGYSSSDLGWNFILKDTGRMLAIPYPNGLSPENLTNSLVAVGVANYSGTNIITLNPNGTLTLTRFSFMDSLLVTKETPFMGLSNVIAISGGAAHCAALMRNGTVTVFGDNSFGQTNVPAGLTNVVSIAAGGQHMLALKADGTVVAWGANSSGQSQLPSGLSNVIAIAAGYHHSLAIVSDDARFSAPPELTHPIFTNQTLTVSVPTLRGSSYVLESKDSLTNDSWIMSPPTPGDGTVKTLTSQTSQAEHRFFRVRKQ